MLSTIETLRIAAIIAVILTIAFLSTTTYKWITWTGPKNYWRRYMHAGFLDYYFRPFYLGLFHYMAIVIAAGSLIAAPILYYLVF